jgi:hypothetical protein
MIIKTNQDEFTDYLKDASNYSGFADDLAIPSDTKNIIAGKHICSRYRIDRRKSSRRRKHHICRKNESYPRFR